MTSVNFTNPLNHSWKREMIKIKKVNRKDVYYHPLDDEYTRLRTVPDVEKYRENFLFFILM